MAAGPAAPRACILYCVLCMEHAMSAWYSELYVETSSVPRACIVYSFKNGRERIRFINLRSSQSPACGQEREHAAATRL